MSMSTTSEYPPLNIDAGTDVLSVAFTANDEYLVSGHKNGVRVWRLVDGKLVATIPAKATICVAASNDGRWIAGGVSDVDEAPQKVPTGEVIVWDAATYKQVFAGKIKVAVAEVDFSRRDSTRLVSADGTANTATIWDFDAAVPARRKVRTLDHNGQVGAARYSPEGDRIATATEEYTRVWDSNNGQLLVDVKVQMGWVRNLLWHNNHLLVRTRDHRIKQIDAVTGSTVLEWAVPIADGPSWLARPQHGKFIVYLAKDVLTIWDTATRDQLGPVPHEALDTPLIACSSDGRLLTLGVITEIRVVDTTHVLFRLVSNPELDIDSAALDAWKDGQLTNAEALLSAAIPSSGSRCRILASRALVRARLGQWEEALVDAKESIEIQRSLFGYIAKCVTLVGKGETDSGCAVCDFALLYFPSNLSLLLLIKIVALFMAGKHGNALSRLDNFVAEADRWADPALRMIQAYMHFSLAKKHMEGSNYSRAIQSFEVAQTNMAKGTRQPPLIISLISGWRFDDLALTIRQNLCEAFLADGRTKEASDCLLRMADQEINMTESFTTWVSDFKSRCRRKLEDLGDEAVNAKRYDEAISQYTAALSLDPDNPQDLLVKRSKVYAEKGKWEDVLNDANEAIKLDSSSPSGYERKYAALLGMGRHDEAMAAFETMLTKMSSSSDPEICERLRQYIRPEQTKEAIRAVIDNVIRDSPEVLINAFSGRLCDKSERVAAFESTAAFTRLVVSMTTHIDHSLIERAVGEFYRYATLSHTWEDNEPLYEKTVRIVVYDLEASPTHNKLRMFCKIVREEGFNWAWSDTCCIDKGDHFVLQEALVSMFKWYEGSAMTIIFLFDVERLAEFGALMRSRWNSRGWTFQEYHASKVVRIYTKDWTPYLGLTIHNHKESPEVISEMEKATGISGQALMTLRPGLSDIREKLRLASTRQTTRVEDSAYSLLGIFSMTLPVTYGEGDKALGRLLSYLLMSSGDASILAWSGKSGSFNSCLPSSIIVFSRPTTTHIPPVISDAEMETVTAGLQALSLDLDLVTRLYDRVDGLRTPTFAGQRMRLPCLAFGIRLLSRRRDGSEFVFNVQAGVLGTVDIKTEQNFTLEDSLYLVHPWIDFLLGRRGTRKRQEVAPPKNDTLESDDFVSFDSSPGHPSTSQVTSVDTGSTTSSPLSPTDVQTRVYKFLARLRQPFGALFLASNPQNEAEYRRVVTESLITVQVEEITPATLNSLIQCVRELDVL